MSLGEADATFVYQSDVTDYIRAQVRVVEIPENLNVLVSYPIAMIQSSQNPGLAQEWIDLVLGNEGQAVLDKYRLVPAS